ncbi:phosphoenolpyruvate--protein phosphotransferase [candidate division KSB1 bacterium]
MIEGIPASPGIAVGVVFLFNREIATVEERRLKASQVEGEVERFLEAVDKAKQEFREIKEKVKLEIGPENVKIFDSYLLILEDDLAVEQTVSDIRSQKLNAEVVFFRNMSRIADMIERVQDSYMSERSADVRDVKRRVLDKLMGVTHTGIADLPAQSIIVAHDLSPSDTAQIDRDRILGFATDVGGPTSHTAILALALQTPAVVGLKDITHRVRTGDAIVLDGTRGTVEINPSKTALKRYEEQKQILSQATRELLSLKDEAARTSDDYSVELAANVEFAGEVAAVQSSGARGVGLYRTEYLYLVKESLPSEQEQVEAYRFLAESLAPDPVVIRTLDLGGDKFLSPIKTPTEINPFLGWRGIRFCLARQDLFEVQLRAIFQANTKANIRVMFPMITTVAEFRQARDMAENVQRDLIAKGLTPDVPVEIGAMIETPSAALTADVLAKEADFFSIGSNDLIQYLLAIDRVNEKIAYLYEPFHPSVIRTISQVIFEAHNHGIWVGMCGEMASDPASAILLLGMEIDELSTSPMLVPRIKRAIRSVSFKEAHQTAVEALEMSDAAAIKKMIRERFANVLDA